MIANRNDDLNTHGSTCRNADGNADVPFDPHWMFNACVARLWMCFRFSKQCLNFTIASNAFITAFTFASISPSRLLSLTLQFSFFACARVMYFTLMLTFSCTWTLMFTSSFALAFSIHFHTNCRCHLHVHFHVHVCL